MMRRNKKLRRPIIVALVVLAASSVWFLSDRGTEADTAVAVKGYIQEYVDEIGEVKCQDATAVYLEGTGLIRNIYVEEGQKVRKGDLLLSMDQSQHGIALQNAEETLRGARARFTAGDEAYQTALMDYNNTRFLEGEGAVSKWELIQKETALKSAEAVRSAYQAELEQAELNLKNSSIALGKQQITASIDGIILEKNVELNELGVPGAAAFVIGNGEKFEIETKILADDLADIKAGTKAEIITRTNEEQVIDGIVVKVAPTATDEVSSLGVRQKKVTVTIKPLDFTVSLKPGSEVDVKVIIQTRTGAIIAPAGAVFDYQGESCIFVVEGGKAVLKKVDTGIRNEHYAEITKGLKEGEVVLSAPDNSIEEGLRIKDSQ